MSSRAWIGKKGTSRGARVSLSRKASTWSITGICVAVSPQLSTETTNPIRSRAAVPREARSTAAAGYPTRPGLGGRRRAGAARSR